MMWWWHHLQDRHRRYDNAFSLSEYRRREFPSMTDSDWHRADDLSRDAGFKSAWGKDVQRYEVAGRFLDGIDVRAWELPVELVDLLCTFAHLKLLAEQQKKERKLNDNETPARDSRRTNRRDTERHVHAASGKRGRERSRKIPVLRQTRTGLHQTQGRQTEIACS